MTAQYIVEEILRRNIADLERELQRQSDRAHAAEMELKGLLEQVPLTFVHDPNGYALDGKHTEIADALPVGTDLYSRPIPAPAVLEEWREAMQKAHDTFQRYADLHQAKGTHDGYEKAKANQKLANKLYALLQSTGDKK